MPKIMLKFRAFSDLCDLVSSTIYVRDLNALRWHYKDESLHCSAAARPEHVAKHGTRSTGSLHANPDLSYVRDLPIVLFALGSECTFGPPLIIDSKKSLFSDARYQLKWIQLSSTCQAGCKIGRIYCFPDMSLCYVRRERAAHHRNHRFVYQDETVYWRRDENCVVNETTACVLWNAGS